MAEKATGSRRQDLETKEVAHLSLVDSAEVENADEPIKKKLLAAQPIAADDAEDLWDNLPV